jgi:hypothetical protein
MVICYPTTATQVSRAHTTLDHYLVANRVYADDATSRVDGEGGQSVGGSGDAVRPGRDRRCRRPEEAERLRSVSSNSSSWKSEMGRGVVNSYVCCVLRLRMSRFHGGRIVGGVVGLRK